MEFTHNNDSNYKAIDHQNNLNKIENSNYLYTNWNRITHEMRYFKGSTDRGLRLSIAYERNY